MKKTLALLILCISTAFTCTKTVGTLEIAKPVFRALKGAANGSAYLSILQTGDTADKLIRASCDACERMEIHDHITDRATNAKKMVEVKDITIPGSKDHCNFITCFFTQPKPIEFVKGGKHLMLMNLKPGASDLKEVDIKLTFEKAGDVVVKFNAENLDGTPHKGCNGCCEHHKHDKDHKEKDGHAHDLNQDTHHLNAHANDAKKH